MSDYIIKKQMNESLDYMHKAIENLKKYSEIFYNEGNNKEGNKRFDAATNLELFAEIFKQNVDYINRILTN